MNFGVKLTPSWSHAGFRRPSKKQTAKACKISTAHRRAQFWRIRGSQVGGKNPQKWTLTSTKNEASSRLIFGSFWGGFCLCGGGGGKLGPRWHRQQQKIYQKPMPARC